MRLRLARRHSWHHHPSSINNAGAVNDSLRSTGTTTSTSKYRHSFFFRSPSAAITTSDDDSAPGSMAAAPPTSTLRRVRFDIDKATTHHDSPYTQDCIEGLWFNHDELKEMKLDCARDLAAIWKETPKEDFARVLEDCTGIEFEEMPVTSLRNERLAVLGRILGVAHYCCSATCWLARAERQRAVVTAVRRAQQRSREANLCQGFLVWRASEQISLPCQRLAHWMAMAVAREEE
eukprot:scaffold7720_cov149-Amphora_coffeaeformis.AAC.5